MHAHRCVAMIWHLLIQSPAALQVVAHRQTLGEGNSKIKPHSPIKHLNSEQILVVIIALVIVLILMSFVVILYSYMTRMLLSTLPAHEVLHCIPHISRIENSALVNPLDPNILIQNVENNYMKTNTYSRETQFNNHMET